jgi:hypothetical protein
MEARTAEVLARDGDGVPMVLRHRLGKGEVTAVVPVMGAGFLETGESRDYRNYFQGRW